MSDFDALWREITKRPDVVTVQDRAELEHVFDLIKGCESYLEVGTAEGNSLFVLSHALKEGAPITYIDFGEKHTAGPREEVLNRISNPVTSIHGDSNDTEILKKLGGKKFDVVFIDAGHDYINVLLDALLYGPLATKYIIFHDVQLEPVAKVFDWYRTKFPESISYKFVNSDTFGYGIIKL